MKHKTKIVQLEFIEIKYLCPSKIPLGKQKKPSIEQKKIFTKMSDKRMYKERTPILNNKSKQFKKFKKVNRDPIKQDIQMSNKCMRRGVG